MRVFLVRLSFSAARRLLAVLALMLGARVARAQVSETPVPFDSAGQVRSITPSLASRLGLTSPSWPVTGDFDEARLYAVSSGGYVIAVQRHDGRLDRYNIDDAQRATLRSQIVEAMTRVGRLVGEEGPAVVSEPARTPFIRNQMILSALLYGPAAATLTHNGSTGAGVYLITTGASFFYLADLAKHVTVTRAQNHLATDGAIRGSLMVGGALNALGIDPNQDWGAASTLIGGIGGSVVGYYWGKRLTDSEAHSATVGSTLLAATAAGIAGSLGAFDSDNNDRAVSATLVSAAAVGYPIGLRYPRHASYTVTAGDVRLVPLASVLALGVVGTPIIDSHMDSHAIGGILTAGFIAGTLIGDRAFVRPVDHTESDATLVWLGALAGGLIGAAPPVIAQSEDAHFALGSVTLGAILGTIAAEHLVEPRRAGALSTRVGRAGPSVHVEPLGVVGAVSGMPGRHPILSLQF
jgi:hypothetical protein